MTLALSLVKGGIANMRLKNGDVLMRWPLAQHIITAGWFYNDGSIHNALDFRAMVGTPVVAAEDGVVSVAYQWNGKVTKGDTNSYGNMVKIKHANYKGNSLETLYAHLQTICVKVGQRVEEGQVIGYSGATGNVQGAHLHYEVRYCGIKKNPLYWHDANFTCANDVTRRHLGIYTSVVPDEVKPRLYKITISGMSEGDRNDFVTLAKNKELTYEEVVV